MPVHHRIREGCVKLPELCLNTLRPRQNGRHFPDNIFKCIFLNDNVCILIKISLNFVPKGPINNISALVQIIALRWPGDKPWSEPIMVSLLTHIYITRPRWVNNSKMTTYHQNSIHICPVIHAQEALEVTDGGFPQWLHSRHLVQTWDHASPS